MADVVEAIARVGIAAWVGENEDPWDTPRVLGIVGDDLHLIELDASNRERVLLELIDNYEVEEGGLRVDIVFFGEAGGFFASSLSFLEHWPKSVADLPAEVFVDDHFKGAFTRTGDDIVVSVRHALRPSAGPPRRRFRFRPSKYEQALADLARESRRLRDDLIAVAQQRAPQKVDSLRKAFDPWPA